MAKHLNPVEYTSLWDEEDKRAARVVTPRRVFPAHSSNAPHLPVYARDHAGATRLLPDPAQGVESPLMGVPVGMPL